MGTCAAYVTVKMYGQVHILFYLCGPSISLLAFVIAIVFTYLLDLPLRNTKKFKTLWVTKIHKKEERKVLISLKLCGFQVGPYGFATRKLGIQICDDIIHNIVTALLLDS